jgi:hypothetical protein
VEGSARRRPRPTKIRVGLHLFQLVLGKSISVGFLVVLEAHRDHSRWIMMLAFAPGRIKVMPSQVWRSTLFNGAAE